MNVCAPAELANKHSEAKGTSVQAHHFIEVLLMGMQFFVCYLHNASINTSFFSSATRDNASNDAK